MTSMRPQPTHQQASGSRHHPYQPTVGPSTVPAPAAAGRKQARKAEQPAPASPPRTQRDSRSPPAGLDAAFGAKDGGKWWDQELPAPPASLSSILDSFRRSGEGDRDLLLAILGAKKAEEERLTSLIQTRLTILQARLSVHQSTMQLDAAAAHMPPMPHPPMSMTSPHELAAPLPERTPSLTSRGSTTSSSGPVSPGLAASYSNVYDREYDPRRESDDEKSRSHLRSAPRPFHLPPPRNLWRRHDSPSDDGPIPIDAKKPYLPSMAVRRDEHYHRRSISPRAEAPGIDMLLDAGRRAAE